MAEKCCICGKKLSALSVKEHYDQYRLPSSLACEDCGYQVRMLRRGVPNKEDGVATYSELLDSVKQKLVSGSADETVKAEMLQFIDETTAGYSTYTEYQTAFRLEHFPEEGSNNFGGYFYVNPSTKKFAVAKRNGQLGDIRDFDELIDFTVTEDGNSVTSGRAGAAAAGAVLAGAAGAIVGSAMSKTTDKVVNQLDITLSYKGLDAPIEVIQLIRGTTQKNTTQYKNAVQLSKQIVSALKQIMDSGQEEPSAQPERGARAIYAFSVADEILKFKQLADEGIISQAEFDAQKQKLLSLDY